MTDYTLLLSIIVVSAVAGMIVSLALLYLLEGPHDD
jgi:hypothetical protein